MQSWRRLQRAAGAHVPGQAPADQEDGGEIAQRRLVVTAKLADTADAAACPTSARREAAIFGKCPFLGFDAHTTLGGDLPPSVGRQLGKPT